MTQREFFNAIANNETLEVEIRDFATASILKMDAANEKRKNTPSKKATENAPLVEKIVGEILSENAMTATEVAAVLEVSVQKASALLRAAVAEGKANQISVKVPKKGEQKAYTLA